FPATGVGKLYIESDGDGEEPVYEIEYFQIISGHYRLQPFIMSLVDQYFSEPKVIFHHEHDLVGRVCMTSVVARVIDHFINNLQVPGVAVLVGKTKRTQQRINVITL